MNPATVAYEAYNLHRASHRPDELVGALVTLARLRPRHVAVEIGCDAGGGLYCLRQIFRDVYGITLADNGVATGGQGNSPAYRLVHHGARVLLGNSHDSDSLAWLRTCLHGEAVDALWIDGDHTAAGAREDFRMYAPLVRDGGLVMIHDIRNQRTPGVAALWSELSSRYPEQTTEILSKRPNPVGWGVLRVIRKVR